MTDRSLEHQTAIALTALAVAISRQTGINADQLRLDFLDSMEGLSGSPAEVGIVGRHMADLMAKIAAGKGSAIPPDHTG